MTKYLTFQGDGEFRQVLILSLLSGKPVVVEQIRHLEDELGLTEYEVSLLKLIDEITNGTKTKLNETGTRLVFSPGFIIGGSISLNFWLGMNRNYLYLSTVISNYSII